MITLASDFGTPYPAAMKGVILRRCDARLVDIGHDFPRQNVKVAAFWLSQVLVEFPPAVHLVVVDPGVGTDRAAIAVRAGDHVLVGPDNGVLVPPARALAASIDAYEIEAGEPRSSTFHGRDVFAPAAAEIHEAGVAGLSELDWLTPTTAHTKLTFPNPDITENIATGEVLAIDGFGNVVTNLPGDLLAGYDRITVNRTDVPVVESYAHVEPGEAVATVGSHGNVELAVNRGRGDEAFDLAVGDTVELIR